MSKQTQTMNEKQQEPSEQEMEASGSKSLSQVLADHKAQLTRIETTVAAISAALYGSPGRGSQQVEIEPGTYPSPRAG
jgi:hypothetical protein